MIRLIISDIDGTLIPEGGSYINPEYMNVIRELTDMGVYFAAASGRTVTSLDAIFHEVRDRIYYFADNGAYIEKNGITVKEVRLNAEDMKTLIRELREIGRHYIFAAAKEGYFADTAGDAVYDLVYSRYNSSGGIVDDILDCADRCIKLSLYCENGAEDIYNAIYDRWKDKFAINISGARWVDVNHRSASKGNAVRWLQEQLGITPEETVVFGDNFNDISMMERSARSYASALSHPDVKKAAKYEVASYEEDGVLQVLKQIKEEIRSEK